MVVVPPNIVVPKSVDVVGCGDEDKGAVLGGDNFDALPIFKPRGVLVRQRREQIEGRPQGMATFEGVGFAVGGGDLEVTGDGSGGRDAQTAV